MKTLYSVILLCAVSNYSFANDEYSSLRQELKQMMELDQNTLRGKTGQDFETLRTKQANRVKEIVAEFGWPTVDMVGEEASQAAWIIVQHADDDKTFQQSMLQVMQPLALAGKINPANYAYLYDRTHSPQLYGTQGKCEGTNFIPFPVQDIKDIDSRRHEMNMTTAQEYWDMASERMCRR
ncbi:DUF6624 domain-containing protein [Shewanella sp.]|uniref:DUF6624 domain-containing protein n=1 Tax=Shewanella sp. TaxID=50422 RepID=UPI003A9760E7